MARQIFSLILHVSIVTDWFTGGAFAVDTSFPVETATRFVCEPPQLIDRWATLDELRSSGRIADSVSLPIRKDIEKCVESGVAAFAHHANWTRLYPAPLNDPQNRIARSNVPMGYPELYWCANYIPDGSGEMSPRDRKHPLEISVSHVVGRALWASLLAEQVTGNRADEAFFKVLYQYCRDMFDNIDALPSAFDAENHYERVIIGHDLREGFLGLLGLMRTRDDPWAFETARKMIQTLERMTDDEGHLSPQRSSESGFGDRIRGLGCDATTSGRLVEPLLEYWRFTGEETAFALSGRFARATLDSTFTEEGFFTPMGRSGGHIHSITSSLAGIIRYAILSGDGPMLDRTLQIMRRGIPAHFSTWGWGDEVTPDHPANVLSRGEINQTGDVIRCALLLGEGGFPEFYEMAERYLRSMLLPTLYHETDLREFMDDDPDPDADWERDILHRTIGGAAMQFPNDRLGPGVWPLTTPDIISGAVHALCACLQHRVTADEKTVKVNLLFDCETEDLKIESALPLEGAIHITQKSRKTILVRTPEWVNQKSLGLTLEGGLSSPLVNEGYVEIEGLKSGASAILTFDIPCKTEKERVDGIEYTTTWVGNQIIRIEPQGEFSPLPFRWRDSFNAE